jgi:hypothetical protein
MLTLMTSSLGSTPAFSLSRISFASCEIHIMRFSGLVASTEYQLTERFSVTADARLLLSSLISALLRYAMI